MKKRITAVAVSLFLLIGLLVCGVAAEGFTFREISREILQVADGEVLSVTWNWDELPEGANFSLISVTVGETVCVMSNEGNVHMADITDVPAGRHTVSYTYALDGRVYEATSAQELIKIGFLAVTLDIVINADGSVTVTATDDNGRRVPNYPLTLTLGAMTYNEKTGADGTFTSRIRLEYGQAASCTSSGMTADGITYTEASQVEVVYQKPTTTTTTEPTTTTTTGPEGETTTTIEGEPTETTTTTEQKKTTTTYKPVNATTVPTTMPSYATILGPATTAVKNDKIAVNVSLDENILNLFDLKVADFNNTARMLIDKEDYNNLVGRNHQLMLNVLTPPMQATDAQVANAIANQSKFSGYDEEHRVAITFDLSFLLTDKMGNVVPVSALPLNSTYIVQLPVPAGMRSCDKLAITLFDGDELMAPMEVTVNNGYFQLEINSLEPYTLIGFRDGEGSAAGGSSVLLIVLLVVGILLLVGAAVLLYLFVLRKPVPKKPAPRREIPVPDTFDENDIFSGRDDYPEISRRPPTEQ